MDKLIQADDPRYILGVSEMDDTHQEFIELVNRLQHSNKVDFAALFSQLLKHTKQHFDAEYQMMQTTQFPAIEEHQADHLRVLGDLERMGRSLNNGSVMMARAYVLEMLPGWFDLHAITMDSALAGHIKSIDASDEKSKLS